MKESTFILTLTALLCLGTGNVWGETLTVMDDDYYYQYVPVDGYNLDGAQHTQLLLLSSELTAMNGSNITAYRLIANRK